MEVQDEHRDAEEEGQSNHPILVDEYDRSVRRRTADVPRQRTPVTFDSKDSKEDSSDAEPYTQKDLMRMVVSLQSHMDTLVAQNKGLMEQAAAAREDLTMRDAAYNELLTELATYREQAQRRRQSGVASHLITPAVTLNVAQVQTTVAEPTGTSSFSPPPTVSAEVRKQVQKKLEKFQPWQPSPSADATRLVTWLSRYELWVRNAGGDEQLMLEFIGEHLCWIVRPSLRRVLESVRTSHEPRVRVGASRRNGPRVRQRGGGAAPLRTLEGEEIHTPSPLHLRAAVQHAYRHFSSSMSIDTSTPHQQVMGP